MSAPQIWPPSTKPFLANPPEGAVGIVLPIHDNLKFFKLAFHSILDFTDYRFMLTIVDNMSLFSTRQYLESIRRNHAVNVLQYQQPHAQGAEWNLGLRFMFAFANVQYGVVLTPDVVVEPTWLSRLVKVFNQGTDTDIAFPKSNDPMPGFCGAFKRLAYERLGGFNDALHEPGPTMADFEDRARKAGLRLFWDQTVYVHHYTRNGIRPDPDHVEQDAAYLKARQEVTA
jgi:hypothetical protein